MTQAQWDLLTQWEAKQEPPIEHEHPIACDWCSNQTLAKARAVCVGVQCPFKERKTHASATR